MIDKPHRPDGDGLRAGTILQIGGGGALGWGYNTIEVRESTGGAGWSWRAITAVENQWLIDALNAHISPPTRDGAKGAEERLALANRLAALALHIDHRVPQPPSRFVTGLAMTERDRDLCVEALRSTPPKPAPDGAGEIGDADRRFIDAFYNADMKTRKSIVALISPAVAAEPVVAWQHRVRPTARESWSPWHDGKAAPTGWQFENRPLYANPPVRGDQDALYAALRKYLPLGAEFDSMWQEVSEIVWPNHPSNNEPNQ